MKNVKILFILLLAVFILFSCRKDSITTDIDINPPTPDVNIETSFNGFITGLNGEPIIEATVTASHQMIQTNELDFFELTGIANEKFVVVSVEKSGYFDQHKTIIPSKTANNTGDLMQLSFENITINRRINAPIGLNILTTFTGIFIILIGVLQ